MARVTRSQSRRLAKPKFVKLILRPPKPPPSGIRLVIKITPEVRRLESALRRRSLSLETGVGLNTHPMMTRLKVKLERAASS